MMSSSSMVSIEPYNMLTKTPSSTLLPVSMSHARRLHGHRHLEDAKMTPTRVLEVIVRASDDAPSGFAAHVAEPEFAQMRHARCNSKSGKRRLLRNLAD